MPILITIIFSLLFWFGVELFINSIVPYYLKESIIKIIASII